MTPQTDSPPQLADLAAAPDKATVPALWAALAPEERREALKLALKGNPTFRRELVELLRATPRYRAFRPTTFTAWSPDQFADAFKRPASLPVDAMQVGLIALHVSGRSAMLAAFLDSLGIPHEHGVIEETPEAGTVTEEKVARAADALAGQFPRDQVVLYFLTLVTLEPETWGGLGAWLARQPR